LASASAIWEPINPAPPVTTYRILSYPHTYLKDGFFHLLANPIFIVF
jgi:hypothetical protein